MTIETYLLYLAAVAVFFATPPDTSQLLVISNSVRHGLRKSAFTIAGDLTANAVQMTGAAFGLAAVIATSATAFVWIKWVGVVYLLWIGLRLFLTREPGHRDETRGAGQAFALFRQGFVTSMANPFAVVFFGALFPQFIDPTQPVLGQVLLLGGTYLLVDGVILLLWGWVGLRAARLFDHALFGRINQICGGLMMAAAVLLASKDLQPAR